MQWGYTCSSEEFAARDLTSFARAAEQAGFEFVTVSDHFHPWTTSQGHSPFAWTTVAAIAATTERVQIGTGVTCPLIRIHPAIVAQAAASSNELSAGRFFLGVGTGEALNEHITGERWPAIEQRREMLIEAISVMRALWDGETVDHQGAYYTVENARLFTLPHSPIELICAAAGPKSAELAAKHADGIWVTSPASDTVDAYRKAGGTGRVIGQLTLSWNHDEDAARRIAFEQWPNAALAGQLSQDLPTWTHFEDATKLASVDDVAEQVIAGDDVAAGVKAVDDFKRAGVTALHFHQVGPDQLGFIEWWSSTLHRELDGLAAA